ncbi:MAG: hypothetical protein PVS3B3_01170 [Ktedonobacteraceae bacterium]
MGKPGTFISRSRQALDKQYKCCYATYVAVAHQLSIPLISWDKEQLQKASKIIQTYTPDTYPFAG